MTVSRPPAHARTSQTHPLQIAEVRSAPDHGRIGITFCPGKHDYLAHTGAWARDLPTDVKAIADWGAKLVLTLVEPAELQSLKVPFLGHEVRHHGMEWLHLPIADFSVPDDQFESQWQVHGPTIRAMLRQGDDIVVHCKGGLGRAGMITARLLAEMGMVPDDAIRMVRKARRGAIETSQQLALVRRTRTIAETDDLP
ncbi:MAG: cyclin-dependent kinase inhibitor 3 family protein [Magnetospirillum sp.]